MEMKKLVLALAGASVALTGLAATSASAQEFNRFDRNRHEQVQQFQGRQMVQARTVVQNRFGNQRIQARQLQRGDRFDSRDATNYRVIDNPGYYNLGPAPRGYRWVQSGNDAVLIAITSGIIGALIGNAF
jgi:Ni/Co efflux regulator RcnB